MMELRDLPNRVNVPSLPIKLDIGCGQSWQQGYVGMDWMDFGQGIKWNIRNGIPLPDDSVSELYTSHCLEHFNWEDFYNIMVEIIRVCQNGAPIHIIVPHGDVIEGHLTCHYIRITEMTLQALEKNFIGKFKLITTWRKDYNLYAEFIMNK